MELSLFIVDEVKGRHQIQVSRPDSLLILIVAEFAVDILRRAPVGDDASLTMADFLSPHTLQIELVTRLFQYQSQPPSQATPGIPFVTPSPAVLLAEEAQEFRKADPADILLTKAGDDLYSGNRMENNMKRASHLSAAGVQGDPTTLRNGFCLSCGTSCNIENLMPAESWRATMCHLPHVPLSFLLVEHGIVLNTEWYLVP